MITNRKNKLAMAYKAWRSKKSFTNFFRIVEDGYTGGWYVWRIWRTACNILSGKYEALYHRYWTEDHND